MTNFWKIGKLEKWKTDFSEKMKKMKNHGGSRRLAEAQLSNDFVKNQEKLTNLRKIEKMEKWKIDFLEICNFSRKTKKESARKIQNLKNGALRARAPFFIFL